MKKEREPLHAEAVVSSSRPRNLSQQPKQPTRHTRNLSIVVDVRDKESRTPRRRTRAGVASFERPHFLSSPFRQEKKKERERDWMKGEGDSSYYVSRAPTRCTVWPAALLRKRHELSVRLTHIRRRRVPCVCTIPRNFHSLAHGYAKSADRTL